MLNENIKSIRKSKGLTQEELAARLHVVRQTISKWEKGLSVPDADTLQKLAQVLDVDVSQLLGAALNVSESESSEASVTESEITKQLIAINSELAARNRRSKKILKIICIAALAYILLNIFIVLLSLTSFSCLTVQHDSADNCEVYETYEDTSEHHSSADDYDCFISHYGDHC